MTSVSRHILVQQFPHGINRKCPLHVGVPSTCHSQHDSAASEGGQATRVPSMEPLGGWQPQLQALFGLGLGPTTHVYHGPAAYRPSTAALAALAPLVQPLSAEAAPPRCETLPSTLDNHASARSHCIHLSNTLPPHERQAHILQLLSECRRKLAARSSTFVGYQVNLDYDYTLLSDLLSFSINNVGDPAIESSYGLNSREFEVAVLDWFAQLWEIGVDEYHGYVTTGGTEGNLCGLYIGRETLPDAVLYTSSASHYSVFKAAHMYRMTAAKVSSLPTGEIDYQDLRSHLMRNTSRPAIINLNIGTTVRGAIDDVDKVLQVLAECGYTRDRFYIHCDAALSGTMLPFLTGAPTISFTRPISSVSVSGHKFIGCPMPCGVVITRAAHVRSLPLRDVEYLGTRDATITCSRSGHTPIFLWYALMQKGHEGLRADAERCVRNAQLLEGMLRSAGVPASLNKFSNTVVFERPREQAFVRKWQLACEGDIAHVVVMPHVTLDKLSEFVSDLLASRARMGSSL